MMACFKPLGYALAALPLLANMPPHSAPPAPDYRDTRSWAASARDEGAAAVELNGAAPRSKRLNADVFYIYPTTDKSDARMNTPFDDPAVASWTDGSVVARQASAFNACCRIFAPRYRQATAGTSKAGGTVREDAMNVAYSDVRRAFAYYLKHWNHGRPLILVGHSQGAAHLERLLTDEVDGKPLARQLVAAYIVGIAYPAAAVGRAGSTLSVCARPDSIRCVVHWSSLLPTTDIAKARDTSEAYIRKRLPPGTSPEVLCINPITFDAEKSEAIATEAKGAVPGAPDATRPRGLVPHAVSARCDRGVLIVEPDPALDLTPLPGGSMHYHDIGMFYEDVRENALLRVKAWRAARQDAR